jgi:hypothetical protein
MAIPEILIDILPTAEEIAKGLLAKDLDCPKKNADCGNDCAQCDIAAVFHRAFLGMGRFGDTRTCKLEKSKNSQVPGVGWLETRDGHIWSELVTRRKSEFLIKKGR